MANTMTLISSVTVGSGGAASIDFNSIPQTYTDLCVKFSIRPTTSSDSIAIKFNSSTTGYSSKNLEGGNSSVTSSTSPASGRYINYAVTTTASTYTNGEVYIPNYAGSTYKSIQADAVGEANAAIAYIDMNGILWSNTAAITSVTFYIVSYNIEQYSTASLYGISKS
jgi:hypothetical protein